MNSITPLRKKIRYGKLDSDYGISGNFYYVLMKFVRNNKHYLIQIGNIVGEACTMRFRLYETNKSYTNYTDTLFDITMNYFKYKETLEKELNDKELYKNAVSLYEFGKSKIIKYCDVEPIKCKYCGKTEGIMTGSNNGMTVCQEHIYVLHKYPNRFIIIEDNEDLILSTLEYKDVFGYGRFFKKDNYYYNVFNENKKFTIDISNETFNESFKSEIDKIKVEYLLKEDAIIYKIKRI